jgi:hypothetical protein
MRIPTKEKSEMYTLNDSEFGVVHVTDSGRFRVVIWPNEELLPGEKYRITIKDDDSFEFDTFEEVKEHLLEKADEDHKAQFFE